jgi:hypothetical protein
LTTILTIQSLYRDFSPSDSSAAARLVMLITVFCTGPSTGVFFIDSPNAPSKLTSGVLKAKLEHLGVLPLMRQDLADVLTSPWCEKPGPVFMWAKEEMDMSDQQLQTLAEEVAVRSLRISCKVCIAFLSSGNVILR